MDNKEPKEGTDPNVEEKGTAEEEEAGNSLDWLLRNDSEEILLAPMDSDILMTRQHPVGVDGACGKVFTKEKVFEAASQGDASQLRGLLEYLRAHRLKLTSPEFTDEINGKTALLKALLHLKDGKNDTVEVFLNIAEKTGDLEAFINASYKDPFYKGQTALHIAIERRSFDHVKLLVRKGADVQAKADGKFFQHSASLGFYFGELPLSLAACTNQLNIVSYLVENPHRRADLACKDSQGNTVLHTLVVKADNTAENTDIIATMYDQILILHNKLEKNGVHLEAITNNQGLTPLKLAAKLGKIGLFKHILQREFEEEPMRPLSRKFTEWVYGPVRCSLYDISSIDTDEENSVLEIVIFGSGISIRPEMLQIEPLRSLLKDKWDRYASKLFLMNFLGYLIYLIIFTTVCFYRKEGQPPFPIEDVPLDYFRYFGELISVLGAVWFFYKAIVIFKRKPPNFEALYIEGFCDILFFLQATLLLTGVVLYWCGLREYVGLLVLSLALAWINLLYYSRGSKQLGMYSVMMQRMILVDILNFLSVYGVLLIGFSAAIVALIEDPSVAPEKLANATGARGSFADEPFQCKRPTYNDISFTILELFKFTIGMGNLEFTDQVQYKEVFYILLILYIVLTYILLLNLLIALMGHTVDTVSEESENIWNLQRAFTIFDMESSLPKCLKTKLFGKVSKMVCFRIKQNENRKFFRVEEINWSKWRSDLGYMQDEDPGNEMMTPEANRPNTGGPWSPLLKRIHLRRHPPTQDYP